MRQTPTPSVEQFMDAIREDADTDALTTEIGDTTTGSALYAGSGRGRGQYRGYGGRGRGAQGLGLGYGLGLGLGYGRGRGG